jgi:glycine cleavage system H lipoate-binding protein
MLAAAFLVTVVVALGGYHLLVERPRRIQLEAQLGGVRAGPVPLTDWVASVPDGVFLQNGFTWSRVVPDGTVEVGVHPMLPGLIGDQTRYSLAETGRHFDRGDPILEIGTGERSARVRAPLSGRITARNRFVSGPLSNREPDSVDTAWLYRIQPDDLAQEVASWMIGTPATEWAQDRYGRIREYLQRAVADGEAGLALADGGEVPVGALAGLDARAWSEFETRFLTN